MRFSFIQRFLHLESASGIILFVMAVIALLSCNSPLSESYQHFFQAPLELQLGAWVFKKTVIFWINEGLMTIFFLLVGLELKRQILVGELAKFSQVILPGVAALGGMLVPVIIYLSINWMDPITINGWAVPVATDIAFALGVLSLFGARVPIGLKLFLMALAIFDDVGAIIIIAVFHVQALFVIQLLFATLLFCMLLFLNYIGVRRLWPYIVLGIALWVCILQSGIHATVAGILLAFAIPLFKQERDSQSPLRRLEEMLHPWVAYFIMPIFALANAGVSFSGLSSSVLWNSVTLGVALGLILGKQCGIFGFSWVIIKLKWASLPKGGTWLRLYGIAVICGIGFTMSLFLGTLAFEKSQPMYLLQVRLGVLLGSVLSGLLGAGILQLTLEKKRKTKGELA